MHLTDLEEHQLVPLRLQLHLDLSEHPGFGSHETEEGLCLVLGMRGRAKIVISPSISRASSQKHTRSPHIVLRAHVRTVKMTLARNLKVVVLRISRKNFIEER